MVVSDSTESSVEEGKPAAGLSLVQRCRAKLSSDIDSKSANAISIYACFLTGFTSAVSFTACYIWCGFQTGNVAQLGLAIARTFDPIGVRTYGFQKPDQQALTSVLSFLIGASLGRFGDKIGAKHRSWLVLATFIQALLAMAGALCAHYSHESSYAVGRPEPSWRTATGMAALGFISASLGLQGIIGKRVGSPLNTTIVLTTTWVEIMNDPFLFALKLAPSRDVRVLGVFGVVSGAFVSRALTNRIHAAGALGVLVGLRLLQAVWWFLIPSPKAKAK